MFKELFSHCNVKKVQVRALLINYTYQVNCAWILNKTRNQWIDLGVHSEACMTQPETCGAAGGAISFWMYVIEFMEVSGLFSSHAVDGTGSLVYLNYLHLG